MKALCDRLTARGGSRPATKICQYLFDSLPSYYSDDDWLSFAAKEVRIRWRHALPRGAKLNLNKGGVLIGVHIKSCISHSTWKKIINTGDRAAPRRQLPIIDFQDEMYVARKGVKYDVEMGRGRRFIR